MTDKLYKLGMFATLMASSVAFCATAEPKVALILLFAAFMWVILA